MEDLEWTSLNTDDRHIFLYGLPNDITNLDFTSHSNILYKNQPIEIINDILKMLKANYSRIVHLGKGWNSRRIKLVTLLGINRNTNAA